MKHRQNRVPATGPAADTLSPGEALRRLREGNRAFVAKAPLEVVIGENRQLPQSNSPIAVVVACSDSRVPPEILYRQFGGELFVIRNAGNTIDTLAMGSLEYAVEVLKVPLIVILGHERCGAVSAAFEVVETGVTFPGSIGRVLEPIIPAIIDANRKGALDLLDASIRANVSRTVDRLRRFSDPIVLAALAAGTLRIVGARYDLGDGSVDFFDEGEA
jgi:carbonic anhydrase